MQDDDEWVAGTNPKDASSLLELHMLFAEGAAPRAAFDAVTGRVYQIEIYDAPDWTLSQSNLVGNGWVEWPQTNANPHSFFRLGVEKQP